MMFEALKQEIAIIKTRRFHIFQKLPNSQFGHPDLEDGFSLPRSYRNFIFYFGNAKLYRQSSYYILGVWAPPLIEQASNGEQLYGIGHYQSSTAYFKSSLLLPEEESPVFEGTQIRQVRVADDFEEWFTKRCKAAKKTYKKQRWSEVVAGPPPFSAEERRILEARLLFTWRAVGLTSDQNFLFEVHNGSKMILPFLSIGVRRKGGGLEGGIKLPVFQILPGATAYVEREVYKEMLDPAAIEFFPELDPEPEDRDRYWEFKALPK